MNSSSDKLIDSVRETIHNMDPYGLLASGAPQDEFDSQILSIAGRASHATSPEEIAQAIADVLNASFSDELPASTYAQDASHLYARMQDRGLVK